MEAAALTFRVLRDTKALLGEVRIFNKNAHAVDIDVAVDDKLEEYVKVKTIVRLPLNREFRIKLGYLPTCFVRYELRVVF
ncbi:unnamed protein product [Aphanomyces euteiches]